MLQTSSDVLRWNATARAYPRDLCIHQLFEQQVERTPDSIALVFADMHLTYNALNRLANQLAHHLQSLGVGPETRVGLCLQRSPALFIGLLAILKAGGAYVPLDLQYPQERLNFMQSDAEISVLLLHQRSLEQGFVANQEQQRLVKAVYLDTDWPEIRQWPQESPHSSVCPDNLGYVIYTSGSTGRPKGVSLSQRALVNLLLWHQETLSPCTRNSQFASIGFDASFHEIFACWQCGGTLLVVPEETRQDMRALAHFFQQQAVEKAILPVVVLQELSTQLPLQTASSPLKEVMATGEQLHITPSVVDFFKQWTWCHLHNHYGPSETHVVTALTLSNQPEQWEALPTIGRPIANTQIYILDQSMEPVDVGVTGELYIGGANVARGYLKQPALTAERFVPDPFTSEIGLRLYRTGDLACYRHDGSIECLGRKDHQVKIRGYRIELGEIEAILSRHPQILQCVVLVREDRPDDKRLVAYIVPRDSSPLLADDLYPYIQLQLPAYMVPGIVLLTALPLTTNGKVDRKALLALRENTSPITYIAPRSTAEEIIAGIWADVLSLDRVGIHDNFFICGGHSLLATSIALRLEDIFRIDIPARLLFEHPTVEGVLARIADAWGDREIVEHIAQTYREVEQLLEY